MRRDTLPQAGRITALQPQPRRARVHVHLDGRYAFSLAEPVAQSLSVGQMLTAAHIQALLEADAQHRAWHDAARLLAVRPRSKAELRQRLQRKGYTPQVIEHTLARLQALGWLDDAAFARQWVDNRVAFRPRARTLLRAELRAKGVDPEAIDAALANLDDESLALDAAQRALSRYRDLPWPVFARRLGNYLARRGFSPSLIRQVVRRMWRQVHAQNPEPEQGAEQW